MRHAAFPLAVMLLVLASVVPLRRAQSQQITRASEEQLQRWLAQYPQADSDGDGKLSVDEAEVYRKKLAERKARARRSDDRPSFRHEYTFATMTDGVKIALAIGYPAQFDPDDAKRKWPAIFSTCGYPHATVPMNPGGFGNRCVTVNASLRGSGASGGQLDPRCERTWKDGYEVIENWIVKQGWSNGRVGLVGHSWPGLMGFCTASTNPPSLKAVCVSGLLEDFYRGICRIGGVRNCGFPENWLNSFYGVEGPFGSGRAAMAARGLDETAYQQIVQSRGARNLVQDMLWVSLHEHLDGPVWQDSSLAKRAATIKAPILIGHQYQDEQTGPSGCWLFARLPDSTPRRLILSNGSHRTPPVLQEHTAAWFDHFLFEEGDGSIAEAEKRVYCYFETCSGDSPGGMQTNAPLVASDFPLPDTQWMHLYLRTGKRLSPDPPEGDESPDAYRVDCDHPLGEQQMLDYALDIDEPLAICGPIVVTLWATLTTLDTDFFVLLADRGPDGVLFGLQRGLLRASHRRLDRERSQYADADGRRLLIRPWHAHSGIEPVRPHETYEYKIEVFPVGHVFRPGHKLVLRISRPPLGDPIGVTRRKGPSYRYDSDAPRGMVRVLHDADHPSAVLLPLLPKLPPVAEEAPELANLFGLQPVNEK